MHSLYSQDILPSTQIASGQDNCFLFHFEKTEWILCNEVEKVGVARSWAVNTMWVAPTRNPCGLDVTVRFPNFVTAAKTL